MAGEAGVVGARQLHGKQLSFNNLYDASAALGSSPDAQLLVDIDLSILGSPAERFERYDQDVRKEYAWVPGFRYQEARAQVL